MYKVVVAGTRTFSNYELMKKELDFILSKRLPDVQIVSGVAEGADKLGEYYASENNLSVKQFPANWKDFGKKAGYIRNRQMAEYSDACVVFWDGVSKGAKLMIDIAKELNIKLLIVKY